MAFGFQTLFLGLRLNQHQSGSTSCGKRGSRGTSPSAIEGGRLLHVTA
ncbi:MAG: hypothetical protein RLP44_22585 [Aggregatilineales bacterium]